MNASLRLVGSALLALTAAFAAWSQPSALTPPLQEPQTKPAQVKPPALGQLHREVQLVNVVFSVLDKRRRFVTDLAQDNFQISEDGKPQQIQFFSSESDLPLRIGLLLDTSNSIRERLKFEQDASFDFLYSVIRRGKDQAFLMTFDSHPQVQQGFTDDIETLRGAIYDQRAGGGTALYDAMYDACHDLLLNPPPPASGTDLRRILILVSDGLDDLSEHARSEAVDMAERAGVVIYTISTSTNWLSPDQATEEGLPVKLALTPGDEVLQQFSDDSGGRPFYTFRVEDLAQAFADIGTELRSQYSIGYTPSGHAGDGRFHTIAVTVNRKDMKVRARRGYWAETTGALPTPHPGS